MWDLEQAITEWRKQMLAGGITGCEVLDELECHLRDDVGRQMASDSAAEPAFRTPVAGIGHPDRLRSEFAKAASAKPALYRKWKGGLLGFLGFASLPEFANCSPGAQASLAFACEEPRRFHHDFVGMEHVLLGLLRLESGGVARVLARLGLSDKKVREEILRESNPTA
jgi:hypothetical protein